MENQPPPAYVRRKWTRAGPKMGMDPGLACLAAQDCTRMGPGVKHPPRVTQDGTPLCFASGARDTERGNPSRALSGIAGAGDQAVSRDGVGCPKKPMLGVMPRIH
jgi:hypothetical protein